MTRRWTWLRTALIAALFVELAAIVVMLMFLPEQTESRGGTWVGGLVLGLVFSIPFVAYIAVWTRQTRRQQRIYDEIEKEARRD